MSRTCVNPLNTDDHDGPSGDQFCIFCLRKRGDDALMMVANLAEVLRAVEWAAQYGYDETAGACPSCGWPEHTNRRRVRVCTFGHTERLLECSSCIVMGADPPLGPSWRHASNCALAIALEKAEAL